MSKRKLFDSVGEVYDFEQKLISHGVTFVHVKEAGSNSGTMKRIAEAFRSNSDLGDWIKPLLETEQAVLKAFFGCEFDLSLMRETLEHYGQAQVVKWQKMGLEVHFLPRHDNFAPDFELPGWEVKPEAWYWDQAAKRNLLRRNNKGDLKVSGTALEGVVALIDTRKKPSYSDGKQMFAKDRDYMGRVIERLRKDGKIEKYGYSPQTSRFGVSPNEWENHLKATLAEHLGLDANQLRLETAIEANIIPQLYLHMPRKDDGDTNTWCWYEEYFKGASSRLLGGNSDHGGLADVRCGRSGLRWRSGAVRPLGVLAAA